MTSRTRGADRLATILPLLPINAMKLLHIDSSILGAGSVSRQLTAKLVSAARSKHRDLQVTYRDLVAQPVGHLTGAHLAAAQGAKPESSALQQDVSAGLNDLDAFLAADVVVLGAPMYNLSISSQLKAWIDRVAVAGKTFRYTEKGPVGLAGGKKVLIASSRGGFYGQGTPAAFLDHQETYLRGVFAFLGVTDVQFIRAEGLATGDANRSKALEGAHGEITMAFA
jgi:FMN-dependent NADH-azoreductase